MKILVVGAGGVGGYFGGRLLAIGRDVTFLVRPKRAERRRATGLVIESPLGNLALPKPPLVLTEDLREPFDVVLLSCKAYDLEAAITSFAPAMGPSTTIVPLLNGMSHLDALDGRFGASHVFGGQCMISAKLDAEGRVVHLGEMQSIVLGARPRGVTETATQIAAELGGAGFDVRLSDDIEQDMWEKWVFIAAGAGVTTLLRGAVGDVLAGGGEPLVRQIIAECEAVAAAHGHAPREAAAARTLGMLTTTGSTMTSSLLRDLEAGARIEADHVIGELVDRAPDRAACPILATALVGLKVHEARRDREAASRP